MLTMTARITPLPAVIKQGRYARFAYTPKLHRSHERHERALLKSLRVMPNVQIPDMKDGQMNVG